VIRLSVRLGVGGGTEPVVRQVVTALGVALGVALLLYAGVSFTALHGHDARGAWLSTQADNVRPAQDEATTDPLLWHRRRDWFQGQMIERVDVAALGPRAPVPPGLARLPGPGEIAVSPALARLLEATPSDQLGDRYPGQVVATIGREALQAPNDLVVVVGHTREELRDQRLVETVRSIEAKPLSHDETRLARVAVYIGATGLFVQIVVFVATATRLAAARREQRLAALRLAGATPGQTNVIAAVEAALAAIAGTAIGFVLFAAGRSRVARIPFDGKAFFTSDLRLSAGTGAAIAVAVPVLAMVAALVTLRRIRVSPLGVSRVALPSRPTSWRLLILAAGLVLFFATLVWTRSTASQSAFYAVAGAFAVVVLGVYAAGPWLTGIVARLIGCLGGTPSVLLASRRLQDNPKAAFRAVAGLTLAVFLATVFSGIATSALAHVRSFHQAASFPQDMLTAVPGIPVVGGVPATTANAAMDRLAGLPGVTRVADLRTLPGDVELVGPPAERGDRNEVGLLRCRDVALLRLPPCEGMVAISARADTERTATFALSRPVSEAELDGLPLLGIAVGTDGRSANLERTRTAVERLGATATTGAEDEIDDTEQIRTIERMSNVGLAFVLLIAGCSLAVAVAGGLVERKRPFALLRLSGMRLPELHRVVLAEAGGPLLVIAAGSAVIGLFVAALTLAVVGLHEWRLPSLGFWGALAGGLALALAVVCTTLPLLDRLTSLESARFE
jgi:FtsX-like permease family